MKKGKIAVIGGPTAVGKSSFAVELALRYGGEVVSADSMQIYRGMNIGTGKITEEEKRGVPHHMIDIADPDERYSVGRYLIEAVPVIDDILARGKLPIITGGTGLYLNALLSGMNLSDAERSDEVREKWKKILIERGAEYVHEQLKKIDPRAAETISPADGKRVIRALEIYEVTGKPKSESAATAECDYDYFFMILCCDRAQLYARINARVDEMFTAGFFDEACALRKYENCNSMQAIGYKQIFAYLRGEFPSLNVTIEEIKRATRNYAKRQLTFFRGMKAQKTWYDISEKEQASEETGRFLCEK